MSSTSKSSKHSDQASFQTDKPMEAGLSDALFSPVHDEQPRPVTPETSKTAPAPAKKAPHQPAPPTSARSGGLSLASRRKFQLPSGIIKLEKPADALAASSKEGAEERRPAPRGTIRKINNFLDEYSVGGEVMPSCHRGMKVLHAQHRATGRQNVVKVRVKKESFRRSGEEEEWRQSTEFMLGLNTCSNIAQIYEVLEDAKAYYVVMEKVSGQDLFESIAGKALLPVQEIKEILCQILVGLAELHAEGRIHKDLKLENVMLDRSPKTPKRGASFTKAPLRHHLNASDHPSFGDCESPVSVKIIDFDTVEEFAQETAPRRKDVLGTDQYIAQEAYAGNYSPASDIFAVGVIAYRLVTGRFPFKADMFDDKPGENWVGSPKMKEIRERLMNYKVKFSGYPMFEKDQQCRELVMSLLAVNEFDRPTAEQALQHQWLCSSLSAVNYFNSKRPSTRHHTVAAPAPASGGEGAEAARENWRHMTR